MSFDHPKIMVVGAGGMGALFGAILREGGLDVTLYDPNVDHIRAIQFDGLQVEGFGGLRVVEVAATNDASSVDGADVLLFQCKSQATRDGARAVGHLVERGAVCISFQNGLGNEEALAEELGEANVIGGLTAMAGNLLGPGRVRDFSRVPSHIGEMGGGVSKRCQEIAATFTKAGLETLASDNIRRQIWKKLLGNIAMSAVSGITNLNSANSLRIPQLKATSIRALDEALAVAISQGIDLDRSEALANLGSITTPGGTGDTKSSLCIDILNERQTEIDYIYGTVINLAREQNIPTPTLETLASLVKGIESHYLERSS